MQSLVSKCPFHRYLSSKQSVKQKGIRNFLPPLLWTLIEEPPHILSCSLYLPTNKEHLQFLSIKSDRNPDVNKYEFSIAVLWQVAARSSPIPAVVHVETCSILLISPAFRKKTGHSSITEDIVLKYKDIIKTTSVNAVARSHCQVKPCMTTQTVHTTVRSINFYCIHHVSTPIFHQTFSFIS